MGYCVCQNKHHNQAALDRDDPSLLAICGHIYCPPCISEQPDSFPCVQCRQSLHKGDLRVIHLPPVQPVSPDREGVESSMAVVLNIHKVTQKLASEYQVDRRSKNIVWLLANRLSRNIGLQFEVEERQEKVEEARIRLAESDRVYDQLTRQLLDARQRLQTTEIQLKAHKLSDEGGALNSMNIGLRRSTQSPRKQLKRPLTPETTPASKKKRRSK
ncbi:hypothetical protein BJ138DRAFT_1159766 [Hygrophoropsis aurantiaca]|uniref:Uncharacterized protein n=1 Tax=Hygrophoropsis aurantiaca TaxID=72124 RepID=A0ACB8A2N0_9AGAM|nr:hypothetical protein BJ138DRAFT_1159766 [Hygrophoropsis aurantiaca]